MSEVRKCAWCGGPNHGSWLPLLHKHRELCISCEGWLRRDKGTGEAIATPRPSAALRRS